MEIHDNGRVVIRQTRKPIEITVRSRFGVIATGDYVRFAAPDGTDLGRCSIPWIMPEDRQELARRIGALVDLTPDADYICFPYSA